MADTLKVVPAGDRILMVIEGSEFALPVYCQHVKVSPTQSNAWLVTPAMDLLKTPFDTLWDMLESWATKTSRGRYALFTDESQLKQVTRRVDGVTPEYHYRWKSSPAPSAPEVSLDDADVLEIETFDELFLREVCSKTQLVSLPHMKVLWNAIIQTAMHWLIVKRRPINFGFCTMFSVPYRSNWKSILAKGYPKSYRCFASTEANVGPRMAEMGLMDGFYGRQLLAVEPKTHCVRWKLETIHNTSWERATSAAERQRIGAGKEAYAAFISKSIKRANQWITLAYRKFVCRAVEPAAALSNVAAEGCQVIVPETWRGGVSPRLLARSSGDVCLDAAVPDKSPRLIDLVTEEVDRVSQVPDLRSQAAKLRISGGYVYEPTHWKKH